jgi:hypothetical protein
MVAKAGKPERRRTTLRPEAPGRKPMSQKPPKAPPRPEETPDIVVSHTAVGRETMAAIVEDLGRVELSVDPGPVRGRLETIGYEDRPIFQTLEQPTGPIAITLETTPIGRETQAAIEDALAVEFLGATEPAPPKKAAAAAPDPPAEIFEISTFIVQGKEIFAKATDEARRQYVAKRLLHRLPAISMDEVVRIDVSRGATPDSVILRIWSRVASPPG